MARLVLFFGFLRTFAPVCGSSILSRPNSFLDAIAAEAVSSCLRLPFSVHGRIFRNLNLEVSRCSEVRLSVLFVLNFTAFGNEYITRAGQNADFVRY